MALAISQVIPTISCTSDTDGMTDDASGAPPDSCMVRRQSVAGESFNPDEDDSEDVKVRYPKTDQQRSRLNAAVKPILLFRSLDEEQMHDVIDAMFECRVAAGDKLIEQGEDGDNFYVIESGIFDVYVTSDGKVDKNCVYDNKGSFGELALMYNTPRAATVMARTPGILWAMERVTFRCIVLKTAARKRHMYETLLESVPLLKELSSYEKLQVADALISRVVEPGEAILREGEEGNEMFFVEDGQVRITRCGTNNHEIEMLTLKTGDYFGELALITKQPRAASAYAVGKSKVAVLDVASFERLLGPCLDVMGRNIDRYREQLLELFGVDKNIPDLREDFGDNMSAP